MFKYRALSLLPTTFISVVVVIASLTLYQYYFATIPYLDEFFVRDKYSSMHPGRMSQGTALCFILLSVGNILLYSRKSNFINRVGRSLIFLNLLIIFVVLISYVLDVSGTKKSPFLDTMAIHTSLSFLCLSIVSLIDKSNGTLRRLLNHKYVGSKVFFRLLLISLIAPIALSLFILRGIHLNVLSVEFGITLFATIFVTLAILYTYSLATGINRSDILRKKVENKIKRANQNLSTALKDRENLFRELHHRIKNNLNTVSSMLYLKEVSSEDSSYKKLTAETRSRIQSIAKTHDLLLQLEEYHELFTARYLTELIGDIVNALTPEPDLYHLNLKIEDKKLDIDSILCLGMLVNEMITNIVKHAYLDNKGGPIHVEFAAKRNICELIVADEGVGMKSSPEANSTGLLIINRLVKQLNGSIQTHSNKGTSHVVEFKV